MKIRNALFAAAASAFIASSSLAYAAYTGQLNIVQWAGTLLGAPTAWGTAPSTGNVVNANVNCVVGCSGGTADATISGPTGTISAANNFSTGLQVQNWQNGRVSLSGTATTGSILSWSGFSGWNSGILECTGAGTQGTNQYEVDISGPTGGSLVRRVATFTGPTASIPVNLAGQTFINVVADVWSSGSPTCSLRGSVNQSVPDDYAQPVQSDLAASLLCSGATCSAIATTQVIAAVSGQAIYVTGYDTKTTSAATGNGSWEYVYGTGSNCATSPTIVPGTSIETFSAGNGIARPGSSGQQFTVPPGNALCVQLLAAQPVTAGFSYAQR